MIVMKFGGTSLKDADAIERVVRIVKSRLERQPFVVASAMSGITDALIQCAELAHQGNEQDALNHLQDIVAARHSRVLSPLVKNRIQLSLLQKSIEEKLQEIQLLLRGLAILGELTPRSLDAITSYGEQLSTLILAAAFKEHGVNESLIDARQILITDDQFTRANPLMDRCAERVREVLGPILREKRIPVTQGFVGGTESGITTTLGRGGSDYSAAIFGALLKAEEIEIWTDVPGVMTADPRVVPEACTIPEISYSEAAELSYFGARVLHPKTILPAIENGIPLYILNTFDPDDPGTRIVRESRSDARPVKAITAIKGLSLISVEGRGMLGVPGVAARVFTTVAGEGVNLLMISQSSSEQSICFVIEEKGASRAVAALNETFQLELFRHLIDRIYVQNGVVIIAAVGAGMKGTPGIAAKVFSALGRREINVISIAQGSSEYNLSLVVREQDADEAVRQIHGEFQLSLTKC